MGEEYKISLGVDIDVDDIRTQIKDAENKVNPIKLNVEIENLNEIKQQLQNLGGTKGKAKLDIPINTQSIEQSLTRVADAVDDIKRSLGSLNSESGMKNLLSSINQIATALGKAEDESQNLVNSLNALSKKDFSFNIGVKMGGSSSVSNNAAYGNYVRGTVIPQLQKQADAVMKAIREKYSTQFFDWQDDTFILDNLSKKKGYTPIRTPALIKKEMADGRNLSRQMSAYREYISVIEEIGRLNGVDISGVNAGFSKTADDIIQDALDIQAGVKNAVDGTEESFDKLRSLFGNGIDGGKLDEQLDSIVKDLEQIKNALVGLPDEQVDGLVQTFNKLSTALDEFINNIGIVKTALGSGMSGANVSGEIANGVDNSLGSIKASASETAGVITELKTTLQSMKLDRSSIDAITNDIKELGFEATDASVKMKNGNFDITVKGVDSLGRAVTEIRHLNSATGEITGVSRTISQSLKESDKFVKQQKRAVADLTNQINQVNRAAIDQNAARPIKETAHLESLKTKYNEIISAIERIGTASSDTFEDERNKVRTLIGEYKSLKSEYKNAENVALQMDGNDFASGLEIAKNNLAKFKAEAQGFSQLTQTVKDLDTAIDGVGDVSSLKEFNNQLRVAKSELSRVKTETAGLDEIKFGLADKGADGFKQVIASRQAAVDKLKKSTPELQGAMSRLNATMDAMDSANQVGDIQKLKAAYDNYKVALKQVDSQLELHRQAEDNASKAASFDKAKEGALLRLKGLFSENSEAAKRFGSDLDRIQRELAECSDVKGLTRINREITNLGREIKSAGVQTQTFGQRFKKQLQQYTSYFSVASLFSYGTQAIRSMFEQVKLIDSAMTELKKVTNETDESYNRFLTNAASRSKELGTTIDGLVSSTADFARLGYGFEDAQGLAEVANIYAVVGDEIEGVEGATESLISTMAAFKGEMNGMSNTDFAMSIIDKFNEIGKLIA